MNQCSGCGIMIARHLHRCEECTLQWVMQMQVYMSGRTCHEVLSGVELGQGHMKCLTCRSLEQSCTVHVPVVCDQSALD
jgi:hypothetical protein